MAAYDGLDEEPEPEAALLA